MRESGRQQLALVVPRQVPNGHSWDYKNRRGREFEPFGNFNYGAGGSTVLPEEVLFRGAGLAQRLADTSSPEFKGSFGDDPVDQYWIAQGAR